MINISGWFDLYKSRNSSQIISDYMPRTSDFTGIDNEVRVTKVLQDEAADKGRPRNLLLITSVQQTTEFENKIISYIKSELVIEMNALLKTTDQNAVSDVIDNIRLKLFEFEASLKSTNIETSSYSSKKSIIKPLHKDSHSQSNIIEKNTIVDKKNNKNSPFFSYINIAISCMLIVFIINQNSRIGDNDKFRLAYLANLLEEESSVKENVFSELEKTIIKLQNQNTKLIKTFETMRIELQKSIEKTKKEARDADEIIDKKVLELSDKIKRIGKITPEHNSKPIKSANTAKLSGNDCRGKIKENMTIKIQKIIKKTLPEYKHMIADGDFGSTTMNGALEYIKSKKMTVNNCSDFGKIVDEI